MNSIEEYKKGGKVKRRKVKKPRKKPRKKPARKPKDKITTQKAFDFFGYEVPSVKIQTKPPDENIIASLGEQLKKAKDEQDEFKKQLKAIEDIKENQMPSGQPLISYQPPQREMMMPHFDSESKIVDVSDRFDKLEREKKKQEENLKLGAKTRKLGAIADKFRKKKLQEKALNVWKDETKKKRNKRLFGGLNISDELEKELLEAEKDMKARSQIQTRSKTGSLPSKKLAKGPSRS